MSKRFQIVFAAIIIMIAAIGILFTTANETDNSTEINQPRTEETTDTAPSVNFSDPYELHLVFEEMSGFELKETQKNKKITYYIYDFSNEDENQDQDVFLPFCEKLKENGYVKVSASADGAGYINQYELLYNDMHYMIFTESSPEKVVLSVIDYNEDI